MDNFLDELKMLHEKGEKLAEGDIDFLIGVANSNVLLIQSNALLRETLEFYANVNNYIAWNAEGFPDYITDKNPVVIDDTGEKARKALEGVNAQCQQLKKKQF